MTEINPPDEEVSISSTKGVRSSKEDISSLLEGRYSKWSNHDGVPPQSLKSDSGTIPPWSSENQGIVIIVQTTNHSEYMDRKDQKIKSKNEHTERALVQQRSFIG